MNKCLPSSYTWSPIKIRSRRPLVALATLASGTALVAGTMLTGAVPAGAQAPAQSVPCSGSGGGSDGLIAAINTANSGGGGTIDLAQGCTYTLTASNNGTNGSPMTGATGENGLPVITTSISIVGQSSTIQANKTGFRILQVNAPNGNLTLQGVTLTGGSSVFGGALFNNGGTVTLTQDVVSGNTAQMAGGGLASGALAPGATGTVGTLTLNSTMVTNNSVKGSSMGGGGGGILNHGGTLNLNNSEVNSNTSAGGGGGIASGTGTGGLSGAAQLNITNSQVNGNTETGGLMSGGGGLANGGSASISGSQINGNFAPGSFGGGIINHGTMTLSSSTVEHNTAGADQAGNPGFGGGIANVNLGGVGDAAPGGVLTISQSLINDNVAGGLGGAIIEAGINQAGPFTAGYSLRLTGSQVEGNVSFYAGAIQANPGSSVSFSNTAVGSNITNACSGMTGNSGWLCNIYWDILGRAPDASGSSHFQSLLSKGTSRTQVALDILDSQESTAGTVTFFYGLALGRAPDSAGMAKWVAQLNSGLPQQNVLAALFGSKEFFADAGSTNAGFLTALYNDLLGRAPDSAGLSNWEAKLAAGASRTSVALAIIVSHEWLTSLINTTYLGTLDRPADATGLSTDINKLLSGVPFQAVEAGIYGSNEFFKLNS